MSRTMGETEEKLKNDRSMMIFADVQQEIPQYLCMDASGELYLCTVGQQDGSFVEKITKKMSYVEAQIFVANACNKARKIIFENGIIEGDNH
ncbi:MAG: hypothetical protein HDQ97_14985 [Lachnospiraceae bacterium]|nr:hypothetical protein [Lachnospiraceae bacterium]